MKHYFDYYQKYYKVPAKKGGRIIYTGRGKPQKGTIISANSSGLRIRLDGEKRLGNYHPTWEIEYL